MTVTQTQVQGIASQDLHYRLATAGDDAQLLAMLREQEMDSWIALSLEREPSYFAGEGLFGDDYSFLCEDAVPPIKTVGTYACSLMSSHVNGVSANAGYLRSLRVQQGYRHRLRVLKQGYASIPRILSPSCLHYPWFTSIASGNTSAKRLLEANLKGMPIYRPLAKLSTLAFVAPYWLQGTSRWEVACEGDLRELVEFHNRVAARYQFSPVLTEGWLNQLPQHGLQITDFLIYRKNGKISACCALWNQTAFKQTVVRRYRFPLNLMREPYNIYAALLGRARLPEPGKALHFCFLAFFAVADENRSLTPHLARDAARIAIERGMEGCLLGMASDHPCYADMLHTLKPHVYETCIYQFHWPAQICPASETVLDTRLVQPEIALL